MKTLKLSYRNSICILAITAFSSWGLIKDLDGDGQITPADSKKFLDLVNSGAQVDPSLDLNADSKVDLTDVLLYGQWVNGLYHSAKCPDLFMANPDDTAAFSEYAKNVPELKKAYSTDDLLNAYPDHTVKTDLNYGSDVAYVNELAAMLKKGASNADTNSINTFVKGVLKKGVGIYPSKSYPNFLTALDDIHSSDMPVIFTTDALLYTIYRSSDNIIMTLETNRFSAMLEKILKSSLGYCNKYYSSADYEKDVKDYLSTALFLLDPNRTDITKNSEVTGYLNKISSEQMTRVELFGCDSVVDFSQFKPRGHYTKSALLQQYFKTMMWLSRADLSFVIGGKEASTRMKKGSLVLWDCVVNSGTYPQWLEFNSVIEFIVGTSDGMSVRGMGSIVSDLGIHNVKEFLADFKESKFDSAINKSNGGIQLILSQYKEYKQSQDSLDLPKIMSFMPQRFIIDSYTFSQIVYPLLVEYRALPSSLDMVFVLGDNSALRDHTDLKIKGLPGVLACQRKLYDKISPSGYQANLYTSWINFLRQLNGIEDSANVSPAFKTNAWRTKMRNTQLMSWAQLRHNTLLYAKQSYTGGISCFYPKAYIEPYPAFFQAIANYAEKGKLFFKSYDQSISAYFDFLEQTSKKLKSAADYTSSGRPLPAELEDWLKSSITITETGGGCMIMKTYDGWYPELLYLATGLSGAKIRDEEDGTFPTIADVHTKPADEMGPAEVLHCATGRVNLMAVVVDIDSCSSVFVGPVGSYYDVITSDPTNPKRLTDENWADTLNRTTPSRPQWMNQIIFK